MKREKIKILILFVLCITSAYVKSYAQQIQKTIYRSSNGTETEVVAGKLFVKFKAGAKASKKTGVLKAAGVLNREQIDKLGVDIVNIPEGEDLNSFMEKLIESGELEYAEPVHIHKAFVNPSDYDPVVKWGLAKIEAPSAWDINTGSNVVVAVIDSGIDRSHGDLSSNIWQNSNPTRTYTIDNYSVKYDTSGWDFVDSDNNPDPDNDNESHGTHVSGIIAAQASNTGTVGVAWDNKLMPVKCLYYDGVGVVGSSNDIIRGIIYAADNGADIINMSYGGGPYSETEKAALDYAYAKGVVLFAASGNDGAYSVSYPAAYENVISVGATDQNDELAYFSNTGSRLDMVAPGVAIYSTLRSSTHGTLSGTSMSCPFAAGVASLVISYWKTGINTSWTPQQVKNAIIANCDDINKTLLPGRDDYIGVGRLNALSTMEYAKSGLVNISQEKVLVYPNPFDPSVESSRIVLPIGGGSINKLRIYSIAGELVRESTVNDTIAYWDGKDDDGSRCASGLYFYYLDTTMGSEKGKITLLR